MHYIICPFSKPEYRNNLAESLNRQTFRDFIPVIVENGAAIGSTPWIDKAVVLRSGAHQSTAKNLGLHWVREHGDASWSVFDCDDYYGPDFLKSQLDGLEGVDIAGKSFANMMYISYDDGLYLNSLGSLDPSKGITGGAMTCRTAHVPDFPLIVGEDGHWTLEMMTQRKAKVAHTGPRHYCYNRGGTAGHTWSLGPQGETRIKNGMRSLGKLPLETVSLPPRQVLDSSSTISRVVMLHTPDYLPAQASVPDIQRYCRVWEYPFTVHTDRINPELPAAWNKIVACLQALEEVPEKHWVLWMDADMVLRRYNQPMESLIDHEKDFMISTDPQGICTGFFMIRNTPLMKAFFTDLLKDIRMDWPWEQDAMKDLLASRPEYAKRVGHISEANVANPASGRAAGALVMHYWANHFATRERLVQQMERDIWCRDTGRSRGRMFSV